MEHPNSKCRIAQAEYLSRLPEEERENKARDIRIGNASYIYHQQAVPIQENRLIMYYKEWLEGLPPNISRHMRMLGFEACKTMIPFTSTGKNYDFNTADTLNTLLLNCMFASDQLKEGEKYDAKPTYKKFSGYRPGVAVIGDLIVGIENSDGNTKVPFHGTFSRHGRA